MQTGSVLINEVRGSNDLAAVIDLCNGFLAWARDRYGDKRWIVDRYYAPEKWAAVLSSLPKAHAPPDGEMLLARLDGRPAGCVMMQRIDDQTCEMKRMFVRSEAQGHKVGRRLCERIMSIASERGYSRMRLDTGVNHDEALALYRTVGFRVIGPYYDPPEEIRDHLVFMEAELTLIR
jgi:GNAT superfamily N-acetyltransferase